MKKGWIALLCLALLTGCSSAKAQTTEAAARSTDPAASSAPAEPISIPAPPEIASVSEAEQTTEGDPYVSMTAAEAFEDAGYFVAEESGSYRFQTESADSEMSWEIYVLDEAFEDALRYLPQVHDPKLTLTGTDTGEIDLTADQFVYCFCSVNSFTAEEPAQDGTLSIYFTAAAVGSQDSAVTRASNSADLSFDAADLFPEGAAVFEAEKDQSYTVTCDGDASWSIYVRDEAFEEATRYLEQAEEPVLTGEGIFTVSEGQYVYCLCSENAFGEDEAPEAGTYVLHLSAEN